MVTLFTLIAFVTAALFTIQSREISAGDYYDQNYGNNQNAYQYGSSADVSVTSRALAFTALWTAILALIMAFVGTVILGITSPTGKYYWCFPGAVHRTTPLSLGTFIGSLFMFANITLVSAVLFGEFKIRDTTYGDGEGHAEGEGAQEVEVERSSTAFCIMCVFLTLVYGSYAALIYNYSEELLSENEKDIRQEAARPPSFAVDPASNAPGFIGGDRFDVRPHSSQMGSPGTTLPGGFLTADDSGELT